jgi:WD repeat-containing protein 35
MGLCEAACQSYLKMGDVKKAIDCCVLLNQWNMAVELAEQHNFL